MRIGLVVVLAAVVAAAASGTVPGIPTIYVEYSPNCTFTMSVDPGTPVTATSPPGPTLPPGTYQIQVLMANPSSGYSCVTPVFTLSGPGVNSVTTFPNESLIDNHVLPALRPSSTYTAEEASSPATTRGFFTTAATGSSASLLTPSPGTSTTKGGTTQPDLIGSSVLPYRGRLSASVGARGPSLLLDGKAVRSLKAGRYAVAVTDTSRAAGFSLVRAGGRPVSLSGVRFVGHTSRTIALAAGHWEVPGGQGFVVT